MSRKSAFARVLSVIVFGSALIGAAGCAAPAENAATADVAQAPVSGGVLTVGENGDELTLLDPHQLSATNTTVLLRPIFDTLVWQNADGTFAPGLAESWDISDDGLTYTFHLREGVTFHDGSEWNAEALVANFEHIIDPATKSPLAASYIAPFDNAEVIDDLTVEVTLSSPYSSFLNVLAQTYLSIISPKQLAEDPASVAEHPIGSGPFVFENWTKGESITLTRNEDYDWGPAEAKHTGPAYLDGIEFEFITEDSVRYNALLSGDVDIIEWTPPQNVAQVEQQAGFESVRTDRPGHPFAIWLNSARAPFDDVTLRQAFTSAIDREAIVEAVSFGEWEVADGYVTPVTPDYSEKAGTPQYDVDRANELLDEAGWTERDDDGYRTKDGERLTAYFPNAGVVAQTSQIIELVQAQAKDVGIDVQIELVSAQESSERSQAGDYDLTSGIWTTNTSDVLWVRYSSENITTPERAGNNGSYTADDELDALLTAARETTDDAERADLYEKAQLRLVDLAPAVPLYVRPDLVSHSDAVQDVTFENAYGTLWFYDTWLSE